MAAERLGGRRRGGFVTAGTVVALLVAMAGTLLGSGVPENALASFDANAWLWSSQKGELARVNGVTGRVDTRHKLIDGNGRTMQVSQTDRYVILRDLATGRISVLDLAGLHVAATTESAPGVGITVALHDGVAFIVDGVQGVVRQLDPATLAPVGQPLRFPPGITGGSFDDRGRLWLLVPSEGTLIAVLPTGGVSGLGGRAGRDAARAPGEPRIVRSVAVAEPNHELALTVLDDGAAVVDSTARLLAVVHDGETRTVRLALTGPATVPARTTGGRIAVTVPEDRRVHVVTGGDVAEFAVPGAGPKLAPCVPWSGRFYCPDDATGTVHVLDGSGKAADPIAVPNPGGPLELEVREHRLFVNAPGSATARVVDDQHRVKTVDKYANNIAGGDPPPTPPPAPPAKPVVNVPSAPGRVTAVPGNARVRVVWTPAVPNGSAILRYVVEGTGRPIEAGANQRAIDVTSLTNGTEYRFTVHAVNAKGAGPKRAANPVVPTAEVPDPPAAATAEARPDGTVNVTWPAANGQGRRVTRYQVTAVSRGASVPVGESDRTALVIPARGLTYGTQYAFTVVAVNDRGASSAASPLSNSVTPYTRPGEPRKVRAVTVNRRGTIDVSWQAAEENGRAIEHYVVVARGRTQQVRGTTVTLTDLPDGESVPVSVRAVNAAGEGPPVQTTARTIAPPKATLTGASAGYNTITVNFTVVDGGSPPTCTLRVTGGGQASGNCTSLTAGGVAPGRPYAWTVTVTNAAGNATLTGSTTTRTLTGTVLCNDPSYCGRGAKDGGVWVYRTPNQNGTGVNDVFSPEVYEAVCRIGDARGTTIDATPWGGKRSNMWVRIKFPAGQQNYIPFAWFRLAEGDNLGLLPPC